MGEVLPMFMPSFNRSLVIEARPERLSSDAGAGLLRELLQRSGIIPWMVARLDDPRASNQVTYPLAELLRTMLVLFGQGWCDQDDADALRFDPAVQLCVVRLRRMWPEATDCILVSSLMFGAQVGQGISGHEHLPPVVSRKPGPNRGAQRWVKFTATLAFQPMIKITICKSTL